MNSIIAANINGGISNQQVANGSHSSLLLSSVEFALTEVKSNFSATGSQGKYLVKLAGKEELLNGQNKLKIYDQNKNSIENSSSFVNENIEQCSGDNIPAPKVQLYTGKISVEWNKMFKIGAGLVNFGNTCFMNTVLQCLTYCPPLANYLLQDNDHASKCTITGFCMMCVLQKHMKTAIRNSGGVIAPQELSKKIRLIAKHFHGDRQEDAHEYLRYVIDHLWKTCLPQINGGTKLDPASKETTVINKIFGGYHRSQVICLRCKKESNTYDHFMEFILDIKQNIMTLERALEKFTKPEILQQDNCYKCPKCRMKVEAQKRFTVYRAPIVATFQLKRFDYNRSLGGKITKPIAYPGKLNLRPYMSDAQGEAVWYGLNAVLVHSGNSCNSGHYYCYVKNPTGHWYMMNDEKVQQVGMNQVLNQCAYVLFYIKLPSTEKLPIKKFFENENTITKGTVLNSHFSRVSETNGLKSSPLHKETLQSADVKSNGSSNNVKKIAFLPREKISFGFRTHNSSALISSPKSKRSSSEIAATSHGGLVPYIKDSSESSSDGESSNFKPLLKPLDSHPSSPSAALEAKPSNPTIGSSPVHSATKVDATGSWIVTDVPNLSSYSSVSNGVTSTTDWQVIEASDLKLARSPKCGDRGKESSDLSEKSLHAPHAPEHSTDISNGTRPSSDLEKSPVSNDDPAQKCDFQKQTCAGKSEENKTLKRKLGDPSKTFNNSLHLDHYESGHSPVPKKIKHAENSSFLNVESDFRNSSSPVANSVKTAVVYSNCDISSRTSAVNGVSRPANGFKGSPSRNELLNGHKAKKNDIFSKGKQENSFSESKYEKVPAYNQEKNSSLYGTEVPTWRKESHCRPSVISAQKWKRSFDDYDRDFDSGKMRKSKTRDQNRSFCRNSFQEYSARHDRKPNGKPYYPHRSFDDYYESKRRRNQPVYRNNFRRY